MTLPAAWQSRRLRVPEGVTLAFADVADAERTWVGPVPVTTPVRTLRDAAEANVAKDLLRQATKQARSRGLIGRNDIVDARPRRARDGELLR